MVLRNMAGLLDRVMIRIIASSCGNVVPHDESESARMSVTPSPVDTASRRGVPGTQAVDRACALVALVVRTGEPLTFSELSDAAGLARSTTSRLLAALERTDLLQRDAN